jgi:hypothetical protein
MLKKILFLLLTGFTIISCNQTAKQEPAKTASTETKTKEDTKLLLGSWTQPNPINDKEVQGFVLKQDGSAASINMATMVYKKWWTAKGKLFLVAESIGNGSSSIDTTQYEVLSNTATVLQLKYGDYTDTYTRK